MVEVGEVGVLHGDGEEGVEEVGEEEGVEEVGEEDGVGEVVVQGHGSGADVVEGDEEEEHDMKSEDLVVETLSWENLHNAWEEEGARE
uniref:Uncharacterized protein n=1 Tax=Chenopodium quinoa TaxID=63459 RepID=A0A803LKD7_CHEQI